MKIPAETWPDLRVLGANLRDVDCPLRRGRLILSHPREPRAFIAEAWEATGVFGNYADSNELRVMELAGHVRRFERAIGLPPGFSRVSTDREIWWISMTIPGHDREQLLGELQHRGLVDFAETTPEGFLLLLRGGSFQQIERHWTSRLCYNAGSAGDDGDWDAAVTLAKAAVGIGPGPAPRAADPEAYARVVWALRRGGRDAEAAEWCARGDLLGRGTTQRVAQRELWERWGAESSLPEVATSDMW